MNRQIKHVMYDSIERDQIWPLFARTLQGNFTIFINFTSVKFFTLTLIAIMNNFAPLITVILAWFLLAETITSFKIMQLLVAFAGALMMILYAPPAKSEEPELIVNVWNFVGLCLNPILVAYGTV